MSDDDAQLRERRYDQLLQQIGGALLSAAPPGWRRIDLIARIAEGVEDFGLVVIMDDGSSAPVEPPITAADGLRELRALMHDPTRGAWFSARYMMNPPGEYRIFYNYDHDPRWDPPIPPDVFARDLAAWPRPAESVPDWLLRALGRPVPTRPPATSVEDHRDLQRRIGDLLMQRAPADRDEVRAFYRAAGDHEELVGHVMGVDGRLRPWDAPPELREPLRLLRAGMHRPPVGTWNAVSIIVEWPTRASFDFLPATIDPRWHGLPPAAAVRAELELFPRAPEHVAAWMRTVLDAPEQPSELSDRDRTVLAIIERRVSEAGAVPAAYRILGSAEGATCLERVGDEWQVADYERGAPRNPHRFRALWDAGAHLLGRLAIIPDALRAGGGDRNTAAAINDWPIQPLPGEPPLTLLAGKHIATLMAGREIVRYGPTAGNLTFADDTAFPAMSLRTERQEQGPRRYRLVRELRTLSGTTVPWHDQPGGGTAYYLPRSLDQHLADGSVAETGA